METTEWRLSGSAYGRYYNAKLAFLGKEKISVPNPANVLDEHFGITRKADDPAYKKMVETEQAKFQSDAGDVIMVSPRYVGSKLGSNDDGRGNTICAFHFNGKYVALALFNQAENKVVVHEY